MPFEIVKHGTHVDYIGKRQIAALLSAGLLIASLIVRPDVAGGLTRLAQTLGVELGALLDHQGDMPRMTHRPEASHLH